ncbi:MAG: monovalent cation/H(+) antiporter subunit G [Caulobacterales bacterium]|uniref:monovalent cation/H(+) antiporter subunit G n=1 Tax=Glycocaulis sp. TaxID=1969725 RepID=UPI003F9F5C22
MIREIIGGALMLGGMAFLLIAAIGVFRLPDPFLRMHASTKAGTLGAGLLVAGVAVAYTEGNLGLTAFLIIIFLFGTLPVAGHLLGRAMYVSGADFVMKDGNDGLKGILPRAEESLEVRLAGRSPDAALPSPEKASEKANKAKVKTRE